MNINTMDAMYDCINIACKRYDGNTMNPKYIRIGITTESAEEIAPTRIVHTIKDNIWSLLDGFKAIA
jgi:hypothetical protein